ncbi:MAG: aldolase/citrate lyase family protein [Anaerolineae bacterium]|nr:aldolase/citrate lyase family protein [Anaerolineae bacterium]MDW8171197.1 aldolase/citrate lyase family protein [Anaerolineae bacterium]
MRNPLREVWASGGYVLNGWLHIPSTWSAELMGYAGWHSLTVDMQHGLQSIETAIQMIQVISATSAVPLARVPWNEPSVAMRLLDAGAWGIICPMVNTAQECAAFVGACRYPPSGYRSLGPTRCGLAMGATYAEYVQRANDELIVAAMIETPQALENLEAIASVPSLDMLFVGTGDLRLTLSGTTGRDGDDPQVEAALDRIAQVCAARGLIAGLFTSSIAYAVQAVRRGYRFITIQTDGSILRESAQQIVRDTHKQLGA